MYLLVPTSRLAENGDYNLSADWYRETIRSYHKSYPMVALGDERYFTIESGGTPDSKNEGYWNGDIYWATLVDLPPDDHISIITDTQRKITESGLKNSSAKLVPPDSVIVSSRATIGRVGINKVPLATNQGFKNIVIKDRNLANTMFIALMAKKLAPEMEARASGGTFKEITKTNFSKLQIPLPPLEIQRQIVDEIAAHQRIIDGARQVVEGWKPNLDLELAESLPEGVEEWGIVRLGYADIEIIDGDRGINYPKKEDFSPEGYCLFLNTSNVRNGEFNFDNLQFISKDKEEKLRKGRLQRNDIVLTTRGTVGNIALYDETIPYEVMRINSGMVLLRSNLNCIEPKYIVDLFQSSIIWNQLDLIMSGSAQPQLPIRNMVELKIPLPPLEIQREIVARIERERAIVEGNRELIKIYEEKIKKVIERVWEG
jgi:restriction endonuclease S subunit